MASDQRECMITARVQVDLDQVRGALRDVPGGTGKLRRVVVDKLMKVGQFP
jgi:hypothetical protein